MKSIKTTLLTVTLFLSTFFVDGQVVNILSQTSPSCNGSCNGTVTFSLSGVTGPYSVVVSNTNCPTSNTISFSSNTVTVNNLCKCDSLYSFTFFDGSSSVINTQTAFVNPLQLGIFASNSPISCMNACDATATAIAVNGNPPYSFTWTPMSITSPTIGNACAGSYTINCSDANGCKGNSNLIILNNGPCAGIKEFQLNERIDVYPNPAINFIYISDQANITNAVDVLIQNITGQTVLKTNTMREINVSNLPEGLYYLKINTETNKTYYSKFIKQ